MSLESGVEALVDLGFTRLEGEVYTLLLRESPATGYRVAQAIQRPAANVYKAIESLAAKGAVLVDDGTTRVCRAVPEAELLRQIARTFAERRARAASALAGIGKSEADERVYQLTSRDQVLTRAREMLGRAREVVLVTAHPTPLEAIQPEIERAAARGVDLVLKTYRPTSIRGVEVVLSTEPSAVLTSWPGAELNIVVDGREHLLALLAHDGEGVLQAVYSASLYLSVVHHNGLATELALTAMARDVLAGASPAKLRRTLASVRHPMKTLGMTKLMGPVARGDRGSMTEDD